MIPLYLVSSCPACSLPSTFEDQHSRLDVSLSSLKLPLPREGNRDSFSRAAGLDFFETTVRTLELYDYAQRGRVVMALE